MVTRERVSTMPPDTNRIRWIHIPANNLSWCHTLLMKQTIETGFSDMEGFEALE